MPPLGIGVVLLFSAPIIYHLTGRGPSGHLADTEYQTFKRTRRPYAELWEFFYGDPRAWFWTDSLRRALLLANLGVGVSYLISGPWVTFPVLWGISGATLSLLWSIPLRNHYKRLVNKHSAAHSPDPSETRI